MIWQHIRVYLYLLCTHINLYYKRWLNQQNIFGKWGLGLVPGEVSPVYVIIVAWSKLFVPMPNIYRWDFVIGLEWQITIGHTSTGTLSCIPLGTAASITFDAAKGLQSRAASRNFCPSNLPGPLRPTLLLIKPQLDWPRLSHYRTFGEPEVAAIASCMCGRNHRVDSFRTLDGFSFPTLP